MTTRSGSLTRWLLPLALATSISAAARPHVEPPPPRRIVSLNLCSDQLVLALADRDQIAGLTHNVRDPQMSAAAAQARGLPVLGRSAEQILAVDPDLIVGTGMRRSAAVAVLDPRRYRAVDPGSADSYADIVASVRVVARAVGHVDRGEALIARMDGELARIPRVRSRLVAAYYQRRGFLTGTGTLIDDLMRRTGLVNLAEKLGKGPLATVRLEEMVAARPDILIVESATDRVTDQGTEMLHHPALADIARVSIPQAWTVCGGPAYVRAARALSTAITARQRSAAP